MIIGLNGHATAGKDSAARFLVESGFQKVAFADALREMMYVVDPIVSTDGTTYCQAVDEYTYDVAKEMFPELRGLMQRFATEGFREIVGNDIWVDLLDSRLDDDQDYVISDVRFENEAGWVSSRGILVRIERDGVGPKNSHRSESELDNWAFDYIIENNGTLEELGDSILEIIRQERKQ